MMVFCDLDGVLADFTGQVARTLGKPAPPRTTESVCTSVEQLYGPDAWDRVGEAGADFWESMAPLPWGLQLWTNLRRWFGKENVFILSNPGRVDHSAIGKMRWCERVLGVNRDRVILTRFKYLLADENRILIDDTNEMLEGWARGGGIAIAVPQPWNREHMHVETPVIDYIREKIISHVAPERRA